jgi:hypothetical protein
MDRLRLQTHFADLESQREAQLKLRQIEAQKQVARQRGDNNNG